jgi:DNA adenine methylase
MSAFGYFGSKLRIAAKMHNRLPPHNAWVELFCGSAAMTLAKKAAPIEVINDINGEIVNFYKQLRDHGDELRRRIALTPYARAELELARSTGGRVSKMERARRFFVAAMMAVNGSFGKAKGGFSVSPSYSRNGKEARVNRWNMMTAYLDTVVKRLREVRIEDRDALELFSDFANRPATLIYLDPPYFADRVAGYDYDANTENYHENLLKVILDSKCMVFISGYDTKLYRKHLTKKNGWSSKTIRAVTKGNNGVCFEREEVIWFNSAYNEALKKNLVPIVLTKKEEKNRKLNPAR